MLIRIEELAKRIGGRTLFEHASLQVARGDRVGLLGPNGAGKSTLLRILAGDESFDDGSVMRPRNVKLGMLRQEIDPTLSHSVTEETATALAHLDLLESEMRDLEQTMSDAGHDGADVDPAVADRYHHATTQFENAGGFSRETRVAAVLAGLGFDETARARPVSSFSGGWMMRIELAKLLVSEPDVLLLDEPTNHLDLPAIQWFEETLDAFKGAVITVSHDRTFLRRHVARVAELDGRGGFTTFEGGYDSYLAQRAERHTTLLAAKQKQDREVAQMERFVERFRAKATKAKQAQSRIKTLEKMERIEVEPVERKRIRMRIAPPPRSGETVIALEDIHKSYGANKIYDGISFSLRRGDSVALAGPNGAGKSTLLRLAAGLLDFEAGTRTLGHNVTTGFYAQHQLDNLDGRHTVIEELGTAANMADVPRLRGHLGAFLFSGDDVDKRVSVLSGGEKARLALAKMLLHPTNFLVLDEPTNHLDIVACEVLEEALGQYQGTMLFVSHDRSFINALAKRVVDVRAGVLREFSGNYDDYMERLAETEARAAAVTQTEQPAARAPSSDGTARPETPPSRSKSKRVDSGAQAPTADAPKLSKDERKQQRERRKQREKLARQISRIEAEIQESETELEALGWKLGDPALFRDVDLMRELTEQRDRTTLQVAERYSEWERLADELAALDDVDAPVASASGGTASD